MPTEQYVISRTLRTTSMLVSYPEIERIFDHYAWRIDGDAVKESAGRNERDLERIARQYLLPNGKRMVTAALSVAPSGEYGTAGDTHIRFNVMHHQPVRESWSNLLAMLGVSRNMFFFIPPEIEKISAVFVRLGAVWVWKKCYAAPLSHADAESLENRVRRLPGYRRMFSRKELDARLKSAVLESFRPEAGYVSKASAIYHGDLQSFPNV